MELAEEAFEKARELIPGLFLNLYRLANTKRILGKYDEAIEVLNEIIAINPEHEPAYYQLGVIYQLLQKDALADTHFLKYKRFTDSWKEEFEDEPITYFLSGMLLIRQGKIKEGLAEGKKAYDMDPSGHMDYARIMAISGNIPAALELVEKALEEGYRDFCWLRMDPDLASLQEEPRFLELLDSYFLL
jgi:tetratricopeptide (TPR) repeat protein